MGNSEKMNNNNEALLMKTKFMLASCYRY